MPFTPKEKRKVVKANQEKNGGKVVCEGRKVENTKPEKSKKGITIRIYKIPGNMYR